MPLTVRPATHADLARLDPVLHAVLWKGLVIQMSRGQAAAVVDEDQVMALVGLYPMGAEAEIYFWVTSRVRGTQGGVRLLLALRSLKALLPPGLKVVVAVKPGHETGRRLARLLGFWHAGNVAGLPLERWVYRGDGQ